MADDSLWVEVVSADGRIWEGDAYQVIARTTEGDLGVLPRHEPFLAALVPCAAEIFDAEGSREVLAVDGGFISVHDNQVSIISQYATLAQHISMDAAEREFSDAEARLNEGDIDDETRRHYNRASAQLKAATKAAGRASH